MTRWMVVLLLAALPTAARAQEAPEQTEPKGWRGQADLGASFFFGNTEQTLITTHALAAHEARSLELTGEGWFTYGEVTTEAGTEQVNRRSWLLKLGAGFEPMEHVSPFATAAVESSLEKRIDLRYAGGLGANFSVVESEDSNLDFSIAALGERTIAGPSAAADTVGRRTTLLRGSARLRFSHEPAERVRLSSETTYQPALREIDRFTVQSLTSLAYQMHRLVALTVSLRDSYDSDARRRGARRNNEGEVVLGVQTRF